MVVAHSYSFIQWSSIVFVLNLVSSTAVASDSSGNNNDGKCNACRFLVETFKRGLRETDNQHFAGGNTAWEEKKLGKFATSETRLVEVLEYACKDKDLPKLDGIVTGKDAEFKCQTLLEEHEESIENWYFHKQQANVGDMMSWLCIDTLKLCCASGHWGPQCKSCPGESSTQRIPCSARGSCDGDGTRSGTGKCKCDEGYVGLMCRKCDANYFIFFQNDTHIECNKCDQSCKGGCTADGAIGCNQCRSGWTMDSVHGCQDINECLDDPCDEADDYSCSNTPGSYVCVCREGYRMLNGKCQVDIIADHIAQPLSWLERATSLLRICSFAGLLFAIGVIVHQKNTYLGILVVVTIGIVVYIEFGPIAQLISGYFDYDKSLQSSIEL